MWLMNMRHNISSGVSKNAFWEFRIKSECTSAVIFLWYIKKKKKKRLNYLIGECHTSTSYDIFRNHSTYPTVFLLPDMWHRNNYCIKFCGKWIFDSDVEVKFPLTQDCLNYTCHGNDTDDIKYVSFLHAIRAVPPKVVQKRFNMK